LSFLTHRVTHFEETSALSSNFIKKFRWKREIGERFDFTGNSEAELSLGNGRG